MPSERASRVGFARSRPQTTFALLLMVLTAVGEGRADIVYLESGGTVSGRVTDNGDNVVVETLVGRVTLPRDAIKRIESAPTILTDYEARQKAAGDSAAGQVELAEWCIANGLGSHARRHYERALELDASSAAAREALGYVKVNGIWVAGRGAKRAAEKAAEDDAGATAPAEDEDARLIEAVQTEWGLRIRAIQANLLETNVSNLVADGRERILAIEDPLAILPLTQALSRGAVVSRRVLVEALARFPHDEATMNLALLAIMDPDEQVRLVATRQLKIRNDARVVPQIRRALQSDNDGLIRNAAVTLGEIGDPAAIDDLIDALTAQRRKLVEIPVRSYYGGFTQVFYQPINVRLGHTGLTHAPGIGVPIYGAHPTIGMSNPNPRRWNKQEVTVFRSEVLEALRKITGENQIGFDKAAWRRWRQEQET